MTIEYRCDRCGTTGTTTHLVDHDHLASPGIDIGTFDEPDAWHLCDVCFDVITKTISEYRQETT